VGRVEVLVGWVEVLVGWVEVLVGWVEVLEGLGNSHLEVLGGWRGERLYLGKAYLLVAVSYWVEGGGVRWGVWWEF
jgi:hypothetical protein